MNENRLLVLGSWGKNLDAVVERCGLWERTMMDGWKVDMMDSLIKSSMMYKLCGTWIIGSLKDTFV